MTYRNEAQQHLVAELRKIPQYNEIYIEKDFNGFTRPYFNLHEKLDLLKEIVNKAKSIDVNAALPLYLDDFTDFKKYQFKFQDQCLDLFIFLNKEYLNLNFVPNVDGIIILKIQYICIESFIENIPPCGWSPFLNEVDIISENVENVSGFLSSCPNLKTIRGRINSKDNVSGGAREAFTESFTNVENPDLSNFECYIEGGSRLFSMSGISDPSFLKNWVGFSNSYQAFVECNKIKKLDKKVFPSSLSSVKDFCGCKNLKEIIGNWDPINPNKKGFELPIGSQYLFEGCKNLKSVKNLKITKNNRMVFYNCTSLTEVHDVFICDTNNGGIFDNDNCPINESYKIWLPVNIEWGFMPHYDKNNFLGTGISHDKLKTFYVDINSVTIDGVKEPDIEKRKKQYEDLLNPNRDFIFKFISLPKPTPPEPPVTPPIVVSSDNGHCVFKNTAVYYK